MFYHILNLTKIWNQKLNGHLKYFYFYKGGVDVEKTCFPLELEQQLGWNCQNYQLEFCN